MGAAGVTEEDGGLGEVEAPEGKDGSGKHPEEEEHVPFASEEGDEGEYGADDDGDAAGEAVHVVEEVEAVGEEDDPEEGEGPCDEWWKEEFEVDAGEEEREAGEDLHEETDARGEVETIVEKSKDENDEGADEDAFKLGVLEADVAGEDADGVGEEGEVGDDGAGDVVVDPDGSPEGGEDGEASAAGDGACVVLAVEVGVVNEA